MSATSNERAPMENYKKSMKRERNTPSQKEYNLFPISYNMDEPVDILLGETSLIENEIY